MIVIAARENVAFLKESSAKNFYLFFRGWDRVPYRRKNQIKFLAAELVQQGFIFKEAAFPLQQTHSDLYYDYY